MTKIIDLPPATTADANTFVPIYQNGATKRLSATALGGGGSGLDLTSTTDVPSVEGTEYLPLNKPLGTVFRVTVQRILDWILARANTWTANQTINANLNFAGTARRITGDFSNASGPLRTAFKTNVPNSQTAIEVCPSGTGINSAVRLRNYDMDAGSVGNVLQVACADAAYIGVNPVGGATPIPLILRANGDRLTIDPTTGNVLATSGALGYGAGAGGTVTQAMSKSTEVTLNKPSGHITTSNSALAAGATVVFRFNNSSVSADGSEVLSFTVAGYDANRYTVSASIFAPGVCSVSIKNNTAASLSEAVPINFAVIKAARS